MKKLEVYEIIMEDSNDVYKMMIPAESQKAAENYVAGNGDIVRCKKSELYGDNSISLSKIMDALRVANFGQNERDIISRILQQATNVIS